MFDWQELYLMIQLHSLIPPAYSKLKDSCSVYLKDSTPIRNSKCSVLM